MMKCLALMHILVFGILFETIGQSSQPVLDSLTHRLLTTPIDTNRVLLLSQLTEDFRPIDGAKALRYGQEGLRIARQLHYESGEILLLSNIADIHFYGEDLPQAFRYFQQVVRRAAAIPRAGRLQTMALLGLGRVAVMQNDYAQSQQYFRQAIRRMQRRLHPVLPRDLSVAQNNLGVMYYSWMDSGQPYPDSVMRLGLYYNRLVLNTLRRGNSSAALATGMNNMGNIHRLTKRYDSTEYYHRAALNLLQSVNSPFDVTQTKIWLGSALISQNRATEAVPLLQVALREARQLHLPALQADGSLKLAEALAKVGQGEAAYLLAKKGHHLLDSMDLATENADLDQLRVQFETEQERNRTRELTHQTQLQALQARKQQQQFWWLASLLLAVTVGLVVSGVLARRLRRQHTELLATRAEQDRLYALIAHDLRSPVMAFNGLADLLVTYVRRQDTERLMGLGGRVRQAAEGLRDLLENLLNWALSQRGELQPVISPIPVADLLLEIDRLYQPTADTKSVVLVVNANNTSLVLADRQMTLAILRNLVSNAFHAIAAGGRITVQAMTNQSQHISLEVTDTGYGIEAEELARLMSSRIHHTTEHYRGRAGLGLRLSRLFAKAQGGQLTLSSTVGQGTTATFTLPCVDKESAVRT